MLTEEIATRILALTLADLISVARAFRDRSLAPALPMIPNLQFPLSGVGMVGVISDSPVCGIRGEFLFRFAFVWRYRDCRRRFHQLREMHSPRTLPSSPGTGAG